MTKTDAEEGLKQVLLARKPVRIANKNLIDYIFLQSLEVAQSYDLPMQIHTGFGDKDLDMRLSNPLHLRSVLKDTRCSKSWIVLLHASYPFSREASYLASVYPQVYLDFGLAIPKLSVHGMISSLKELLELAPMNKVQRSPVKLFSLFYVMHALMVITQFPRLWKLQKISLQEMQSVSISFANGVVGSHNNLPHGCLETDVSFVRAVPRKRFNDDVTKNGVGLAFASLAMMIFMDGPADGSGLSAVGETRLMPDLSTKRRIPWNKQDEWF